MKTERIKSFVLFSLVIMSFILTTRIWFNVSIEGFFVTSPKDKLPQDFIAAYKNENLLKPNKIVVHIGANHTLLFNNQSDKTYYNNILKDTNEILKDLLNNKENYVVNTIGIEQLQSIRDGKAVELIYKPITELDYIKSLLDVQKNLWNDIKQVNSIVISSDENKIYVVDQNKPVIHEFTAISMPKDLDGIIEQIKAREDFAVFLSDFNEENKELYGKYAIAPVSVTSMPVLSVKKEFEATKKLSPEIADFFDEDSSKISPNPDADGAVTFTDREEETVRIDTNGVLEYYKYNVTSKATKYTDIREAIGIATDYVNQHYVDQHMGLNKNFYISNIEKSELPGGRTSYIISFDYEYNGIPIFAETDSSKSAIEVEVVGQEVKRYKRNVRTIISEAKTVNIKTFDEVLNIVQGGLDNYLSTTKSESIVKINDLYLAYFEGKGKLTPVWVADVDVESSVNDAKTIYNKKYIIEAEVGSINVILGEQ